MRVIHVVPAVAVEASGPSYSVVRLSESLIEAGTDVRLAALDWAPASQSRPFLQTFPLGLGPKRLGISPTMRRWLHREVAQGRADIIHNHGLWMMPNVYTGRACRGDSRCHLVVSPRGTLSRWALARHALQKEIFWQCFQKAALREAACFHATSEAESEDIRARGFKKPICILPNGIDVRPLKAEPAGNRRQLLFLGRIHPVKGVHVLLHSWQAVQDRFDDWELHIAGPDNQGHLAKMQDLAARLRLKRVVFRGPLYGDEKQQAYRTAELYVLPTLSENFGITVAEALAVGTPAIVTSAAPWHGLNAADAGWSIDLGVEPLVACLEEALATPRAKLAQMGTAGRDWMIRDYSWQRTGEQLSATYRWLLNGGSTPAWVSLN
jgi:glycosyltransferase involved in cell wall biosynthesis